MSRFVVLAAVVTAIARAHLCRAPDRETRIAAYRLVQGSYRRDDEADERQPE